MAGYLLEPERWPKLVACRKRPERIYIRFGRWSGRSRNYATLELERGVSVYPARFNADGAVTLDIDDALTTFTGWSELQYRAVWAVTGREICRGTDGEPVLQGVVARPYAIAADVYRPDNFTD